MTSLFFFWVWGAQEFWGIRSMVVVLRWSRAPAAAARLPQRQARLSLGRAETGEGLGSGSGGQQGAVAAYGAGLSWRGNLWAEAPRYGKAEALIILESDPGAALTEDYSMALHALE